MYGALLQPARHWISIDGEVGQAGKPAGKSYPPIQAGFKVKDQS